MSLLGYVNPVIPCSHVRHPAFTALVHYARISVEHRQIMRRHYYGRTLEAYLLKQVYDVVSRLRVKIARRLIGYDYLRPVKYGPRYCYALLFAA